MALFSVAAFSQRQPGAAPQRSDEAAIRAVADNLLAQPVRNFTAPDGTIYTNTADIPEGTNVRISTYADWHYSNGVINMAMIKLGNYLNDPKYVDYAKRHVEFGFDNHKYFQQRIPAGRSHVGWPFGTLWTFRELDDCGAMGASVIDVYGLVPRADYKEYIENSARHIMTGQDRLPDGTLCRTFPRNPTVWADDMYMSVSFLARMGKFTGDNKYYDEAIKQVSQICDYLWDGEKGLYYHCYYPSLGQNGVAYWGRATGWIMVSITHVLDVIPENYPGRDKLIERLEKQIVGAARYQAQSGMWHQLLDKPDSYEESSVTAMYVYCIARAVNEKWIDAGYSAIAESGWNALKRLQITEDGRFTNVCVGTGISQELTFYYNRPVGDNERHGIGLIIDAGIEIMKLRANQPQQRRR